MSNRTDGLVGKRIAVSIGEPWDFESSAGENRLEGVVTAVARSGESAQWCLCAVSAFDCAGAKVSTVGVVDRYSEATPLSERLIQGESAHVNLPYDPTGNDLTPASLRKALSSQQGLRFLVGSVRVEPDQDDGPKSG